jgi:histidinol dehydrogenase
MKRTSFITYDAAALAGQADAIACLAEAEGLSGHARSVLLRAKGKA